MAKNKYDVIIIGSGISGLTAANRLAKEGYSVVVFEQNKCPGGLATWFKRKNHMFDISLHALPFKMKQTFKMYWGNDFADSVFRLSNIKLQNPQFSIETKFDQDDFKRILYGKFNLSKKDIDGFFRYVNQPSVQIDKKITIKQLFNNFFNNRNDVTRFLLEPIFYANGLTLQDPAFIYSVVFSNFMEKGIYSFKGGSDRMLDMMTRVLNKNNVKIILNSLVDKIVVSNKAVKGVVVGGKFIEGKSVISNAGLLNTVQDLVGKDFFSRNYYSKIKNVRLSNSSCQVYIGLKKGEIIPHLGDIILYSEDQNFNLDSLLSKNIKSRCFSVYYNNFRLGQESTVIVATSNAKYSDWEHFTKIEYKKEKKNLINSTIGCLDKYIPGIQEKIDYVDAATPRTFFRYVLHKDGATFGTKYEGLKLSLNLFKEIQGLYHAGSVGIIMSGWLGVANYGAIVGYSVDKYLRNKMLL